MSDLFDDWYNSVELILGDDLISYYAFFTTILAEISYLWVYMQEIAKPFTFILLGFIANVLVIAFVRGYLIRKRKEAIITSIVYVLIYIGLFIGGAYYAGMKISVILTAIPFVVAFLWINIREYQNTTFGSGFPKIVYVLSNIFGQGLSGWLSQIIVLCGPIMTFTAFFAMIPTIPFAFKIIIPIIYFLVSPFIALLEDNWATENIFELATEWDFY